MFALVGAVFCTVDTGNFKNCEAMRFCKANLKSQGEWKMESPKYENGVFEAKLISSGKVTDLLLTISTIESGGFRIRVEPGEKQDFKYDLSQNPNVIDQNVLSRTVTGELNSNAKSHRLVFGDVTVEVISEPLVISLSRDGQEIVRVNADQQLVFEHGDSGELKESYNGFTDTIPHGTTAVGADVLFIGEDVQLSGLPERASSMNLADTEETPLRLFNSDAFEYEADNPIHLYGSIPYVVAHSVSTSASVFWVNPSDTFVDILTRDNGRKCRFLSEGGFVDMFVFIGEYKKITREYCSLTGFPVMPPLFALGYHQSRWGYATQHEVGIVMRGLDEAHIPFDAIWLDLDHLIQKSPFTFSRSGFPNPQQLMSDLRQEDRYLVKLCDPHLPHNSDHKQYKEVRTKKYSVSTVAGTPFVGDSWPGQSVWPDFMNPAVVQWWGQQLFFGLDETAENVFYWNDMNEPSIFKSDESTFPKSLRHSGGYENREVHNIYGLMNTVGSHQGLMARNPDQNTRPFVMTRSFFAGSQKFSWTWTGDNTASWEHLVVSVPMTVTLGLCGMPFAGADIGGFLKSPDGALLARWFEVGAWTYPFFREHCHHKTSRREPFMFDGEEKAAMKKAVIDRYQMLPLWYTAAKVANETGLSPVAPLWVEFPDEQTMHDIETEVIVGQTLLICPVTEDDVDDIEITKPPGKWYRYPTGKELAEETETVKVSLADTPVFIRGGRILPTFSSVGKSAAQTVSKPMTLYVALDENQEAEGEIYLDDGVSYNFMKGEYIRRVFKYTGGALSSTGPASKIPESLVNSVIEKVIIFGTETKTATINRRLSEDFEVAI